VNEITAETSNELARNKVLPAATIGSRMSRNDAGAGGEAMRHTHQAAKLVRVNAAALNAMRIGGLRNHTPCIATTPSESISDIHQGPSSSREGNATTRLAVAVPPLGRRTGAASANNRNANTSAKARGWTGPRAGNPAASSAPAPTTTTA